MFLCIAGNAIGDFGVCDSVSFQQLDHDRTDADLMVAADGQWCHRVVALMRRLR